MNRSRATCVCYLAGVASLVLIAPTWANFGPRYWGDRTSEPKGLNEVAIVHERLSFDMRPLADANLVRVEVTYDLRNAGEAKQLELLFVSGEVGLSNFEARLGEQPLHTRLLPEDESRRIWKKAPASWQPPMRAPDIYYLFRHPSPELATFSLDLPPGASTLHLRYQACACGSDERTTVTWHLPYVLAPAREWGSFGQLDVEVRLPAGWNAWSAPTLDRDGDTLCGSFTGLPADALLLSTNSPVPQAYYRADWLLNCYWVALLVVGLLAAVWAGFRFLGGRAINRRYLRVLVLSFVPLLLWVVLMLVSMPVSRQILKMTLKGQENPSFDSSSSTAEAMLTFTIIPMAVVYVAVLLLGSVLKDTPLQPLRDKQ